MSPNKTNTESLPFKVLNTVQCTEFSKLSSELKIESASESLFDYVRFKSAYGDSNNVINLKREFNNIFNLLNESEQTAAVEMAYQKLIKMHIVK